MKWTVALTLAAAMFSSLSVYAQLPTRDVCCYGVSKGAEGKFTPFAGPKKFSDCKTNSAGFRPGQKICGSMDSVDACADMTLKQICEKCGYHWLADLSTCSEKTLEELVPKEEDPDAKKKSRKK